MYYLSTYTYIEQLKHKIKLKFKLNKLEAFIIIIYSIDLSYKIIEYMKSNEFKKIYKEIKEKYNGK